MRQIAIALGYSHLDFFTLAQLLERYTVPARFCVTAISDTREGPYLWKEGQATAKAMAVGLARKYHAPLCIAIVAVRFVPTCAAFRSASMDIAIMLERGDLQKLVQLTPLTTRNASLAGMPKFRRPNEAHYAREAARTLLEAIREREKTLHLV
jgi:hypothetical protein